MYICSRICYACRPTLPRFKFFKLHKTNPQTQRIDNLAVEFILMWPITYVNPNGKNSRDTPPSNKFPTIGNKKKTRRRRMSLDAVGRINHLDEMAQQSQPPCYV